MATERSVSSTKWAVLFAALAALLLAGAQFLAARHPRGPFPVFERPVLEEYALFDVASVLMGARRLGADMAFIQMLQYYAGEEGSGEEGEVGREAHKHHDATWAGEGAADLNPDTRLPFYPELKNHFLRMAELDPYFHYAYLFGAGALAFNLNRNDEAIDVLRRGAERDPSFWRFRLYAGAIAFRRSAELGKVIALLEEAIRYPDCPSMLENILANLHKKTGNFRRAAEIYQHIIETSRDAGYVSLARQKLQELVQAHGAR